mgnify:CR=1 FL=1
MTAPAPTQPTNGPGRTWPAGLDDLVGRDWSAPRAGRQDRWVVRGGPGSGKTSLIVDVVRAAGNDLKFKKRLVVCDSSRIDTLLALPL